MIHNLFNLRVLELEEKHQLLIEEELYLVGIDSLELDDYKNKKVYELLSDIDIVNVLNLN